MTRIIVFNKPYQVMSQFREIGEKVTLSHFFDDPSLRVAGRLDFDSEGLLILSDSGQLIQKITNPRHCMSKTYLAQVEGEPNSEAIDKLRHGLTLKDGVTSPAHVDLVDEPPDLWRRDPPIRYRANIPESWLKLTITEGRNRQVRRMTAAVGFPTLRLIRLQIGEWTLSGLTPGKSKELNAA